MQPGVATPGLPAILQALSAGGQPVGNMGKLPTPMSPEAINAPPGALPGAQPSTPGLPQAGAVAPNSGAAAQTDPQMLQMILQALLQSGAFNAPAPPA